MTEDEMKRIVRTTVQETVHQTLSGLGFSVHEPHELQADILYLRRVRKGSEFCSMRAKAGFIAFLIPTFLFFVWEAFKLKMKQ